MKILLALLMLTTAANASTEPTAIPCDGGGSKGCPARHVPPAPQSKVLTDCYRRAETSALSLAATDDTYTLQQWLRATFTECDQFQVQWVPVDRSPLDFGCRTATDEF